MAFGILADKFSYFNVTTGFYNLFICFIPFRTFFGYNLG